MGSGPQKMLLNVLFRKCFKNSPLSNPVSKTGKLLKCSSMKQATTAKVTVHGTSDKSRNQKTWWLNNDNFLTNFTSDSTYSAITAPGRQGSRGVITMVTATEGRFPLVVLCFPNMVKYASYIECRVLPSFLYTVISVPTSHTLVSLGRHIDASPTTIPMI